MNCEINAKKVKGFISLNLTIKDDKGKVVVDNVPVKVNDFGGTQNKRAKLLTYKIFKAVVK